MAPPSQAGIVDKMILFYAPKIMGTGGVPMAQIPSRWFAKSPALQNLTVKPCGSDFVVQGYFRDVYVAQAILPMHPRKTHRY